MIALPNGQVNALVFDVDGTLYRQGPLRRAILVRLLGMLVAHPLSGWKTLRVLREYRRAQETLRADPVAAGVGAAQIRLTCERTGADRDWVISCVTRWMEQEPLAFLAPYIQPGLLEFLRVCKVNGLRLGVLSDYPAEAKLRALGLADFFDVVVCAQSPDVDVFKPHPRGLLVALEQLGSTSSETLYIADRVDVDAAAAAAAGVRCAILVEPGHAAAGAYIPVSGYSQLRDLLWPDRSRPSTQLGDDAQDGSPLRRH